VEVRRLALVSLAFLVLVPTASGKILLGVLGDPSRFAGQTGQRSQIGHVFLGWNQGYTWGGKFARQFAEHAPIPMIAMTMSNGWPHPREAITPAGLANGKGDAYLNAFNQAIAQWGKVIYVRPFPEMNGHWNAYCAYTKGGSFKGASHSTRMFRKAFARVYLLLHGGTAVQLNARLRALGLPGVVHDFAVNPYPRLRIFWNPQGDGSPNLAGNRAQAYYPGNSYVDIVGNDLYDIRGKAEWAANDRLYKAHKSKPYAIGEWGLWGLDDPSFVRRMAGWVKSHYRVQVMTWYESKAGSIFDLGTKPRSRAAYRRYITPLG